MLLHFKAPSLLIYDLLCHKEEKNILYYGLVSVRHLLMDVMKW